MRLTYEEAVEQGLAFHLTGHFDMARHIYGLILRHRPEYGLARLCAEWMAEHEGLDEEAIVADVRQRAVPHALFYTAFGYALGHGGWFDAAAEQFETALRLDPQLRRARDGLQQLLPGTPFTPFPLQPVVWPEPPAAPGPTVAGGTPLILGTAVGYDVAAVAPWVKSLRQGYRGAAALLVADDPTLQAFLAAYAITAIPFVVARWPGVHVQTARFACYLEYLEANAGRYDQVFLCDVRDLLFQGDPFAHQLDGDIFWFLEEASTNFSRCANNSLWVKGGFGRAVYARLADRRISCSGTTLGRTGAILRYLRLLLTLFNRLPRLILAGQGHDQAVHNVIAHFALLDGGVFIENHRHVATIHHTPAEDLQPNASGWIAYRGGHVCPVLHQYDRHQHLADWVRQRFGDHNTILKG